ncbi:unnamed protein product [Gongylonema pulchrum]|uniref:DDE_Tnp_1_7 domain-containing protein n=1 Tax=Gongylonema pulchrum TaxID=637853 RepID=A0A183DB10_9BILA|nr:unnamed protein product [Gongylonema pulchrum]
MMKLIAAYAPTSTVDNGDVEHFYDGLEAVLRQQSLETSTPDSKREDSEVHNGRLEQGMI